MTCHNSTAAAAQLAHEEDELSYAQRHLGVQEYSKDAIFTPTHFLMADLCVLGKQDELEITYCTAFTIRLDAAHRTCWWPQ